MKITSLQNSYIKYLNKLKENDFSKNEKKFLIEGFHLVNEAKEYLSEILVLEYLDEYKDIKQIEVSKEILEKLSSGKSKARIIGICNYIDKKDIHSNILVYLNAIQDPGNVGTIFRTALAFSFFDILIDEKCAFKYNQKVIQSSQGAIFKENIVESNFNELLEFKNKGYKIIVTTLSEKSVYLENFNFNINDKYIIVFGNEGQGVSKEIINISDYQLKIKMNNIDSLNVAISAGIILNRINEKRTL